jgi:tetratricopeptide (TPR) repeat protein
MLEGWRRTATVLTSIGICVVANPASAQPDRSTAKARALVTKANARADAGDHEGAIKLYRDAYEIAPDPALLTNIASQLVESGKAEEALKYFCMYLELAPSGSNVPFATSKAKALQIRLGNKNVDDDDVCAPPKPPPREREQPEIRPPEPVPPSEVRTENPPAEPTLNYAGLATGVVGLAALGVGVYAGVKAKSISDEITNHPITMEWETDIKSLQARGQRYEYIQIGTLIGGGVLVVTSVILFVRSGGLHAAPRDKTAISITPTTRGFAVFGTF